jgi:hypothetical protein
MTIRIARRSEREALRMDVVFDVVKLNETG